MFCFENERVSGEKKKERWMRKIAIFFLMLGIFGCAAMAQEYQEGIPWGNAYFKPSVELVYTHSDNIFLTDESMGEILQDSFWMVRPQIAIEFPFENSYVNLQVQYEYKDYEDYDLVNHGTWFGVLDSQFKFSNGSTLGINDHYVYGVQQVSQFDPDMEATWNVTRFQRNLAEVKYEIPVSALNTLGFFINHNEVNFKEDHESGVLPFFSFVQKGGGLTWKYHYQPLASMILEYEHVRSTPTNDNYLNSPIGWSTTEKNYDADRISVGWEGNAQRKLSGFAKIGYQRMEFDDHTLESFDDFKGIVADAGLTYKLAEFSDLNAVLFRHANQSAFNVNNYYTSVGADLRLHHQFNRHLFATVGGKYQVNDYPEAVMAEIPGYFAGISMFHYLTGQHRNDDIALFLAELGYHFSSRVSMRFNYQYEDRDSNLNYVDIFHIERKPYSYNENRFLLQIQMGW